MFDEIIDQLIREEQLGETWRIELAPTNARYSFSSKKSGKETWAKALAQKLITRDKEDYKFIGIFSEGESSEGPIVDGFVYHCTSAYLDKAPHMHRDKKKACKKNIKTGVPVEYFED